MRDPTPAPADRLICMVEIPKGSKNKYEYDSALGGIVFDRTGSYDVVWWLAILFGVLSALINLPIVEAPVTRPVAQPA